MTTEEIRQTWAEAASKIPRPTEEELTSRYLEKKQTALQRLTTRYLRFANMSMICVLVFSGLFFIHTAHVNIPWWIVLVMICYFAIASAIDYWLYSGIKSIDCYTMTVMEVCHKAWYYRKKHLQFMICLIPFALVVVGLLIYGMRADFTAIMGAIIGFIFGALAGYRQFKEFMSDYRQVTDES